MAEWNDWIANVQGSKHSTVLAAQAHHRSPKPEEQRIPLSNASIAAPHNQGYISLLAHLGRIEAAE